MGKFNQSMEEFDREMQDGLKKDGFKVTSESDHSGQLFDGA